MDTFYAVKYIEVNVFVSLKPLMLRNSQPYFKNPVVLTAQGF